MALEISSYLSLFENNERWFGCGVAFCIILISLMVKSPSVFSNYHDNGVLMRIKNDFSIKRKAVQDISKVKHLTEHVRQQTQVIKSSIDKENSKDWNNH